MIKAMKIILWIIVVVMTVSNIACQGQAAVLTDAEMKKKANELAQKYMIVDTHQDVPYRLTKKKEDISRRTKEGESRFVFRWDSVSAFHLTGERSSA